jgi:hypothetical protein
MGSTGTLPVRLVAASSPEVTSRMWWCASRFLIFDKEGFTQ